MKYGKLNNLYEYNIYGIYHNMKIRVLLNEKNELLIRNENNKQCCLYMFDEDDVPNGMAYQTMSFSCFYEMLVFSNYKYFNYFYSEGFSMHVDAYESFTRDTLDAFLKIATKEIKDNYHSFLLKT